MKIFTHYYAGKKIPDNIEKVSISLYKPKWFEGKEVNSLKPTKEILLLKNHPEAYRKEFLKHLDWIGIPRVLDELREVTENFTKSIALCCYEKPEDFCHRQIVAEFINERCRVKIEEFHEEVSKEDVNWTVFKILDTEQPKFVDDNIWLEEETHTYKLKDDSNQKFVSGTTFLGKWFDKFNREKMAHFLINYTKKYRGCTNEELYEKWEQSGIDGTANHLELEEYSIDHDCEHVSMKKALQGKKWFDKVMASGKWQCYPEVIFYNRELGIAGTADLVFRNKVTGSLVLGDWKTNNRITRKAFSAKVGGKYISEQFGYGPCKHLPNANYYHYALQMSLYRYMLEEFLCETVETHYIIHIQENAYAVYETPYLKEEIVNMINEFVKMN